MKVAQLFKNILPVVLILVLGGFLRFYNLGYSEFQDDEKKAFVRKSNETSYFQFFMEQRKGPMQFLVTEATKVFEKDTRNEIVFRAPFTVMNILSLIVLYLIFKELFKSELVSFLGTLLFTVNGFIVGFSRIAQYQNINILFSLLAFYFFVKLSRTENKHLLFSLMGTLSFCISLLAHWDAIFFVFPIFYFYVVFIKKEFSDKRLFIKVTLANLLLGCLLIMPFLVPYLSNYQKNISNQEYFDRRIGMSDYTWDKHIFIFELYNPYFALLALPFLAYFGLFNKKSNFFLFLWFMINFLSIRYFMEKPGTHIYNYVIPLIFLSVSGISFLHRYKEIFRAIIVPLLIILGLLYYQSYVLFVDNEKEYPWDKNELFSIKNVSFVTEPYQEREILTFGFPHFRNWKKVNEIISSDPDNCTYISNEGKEITQIYLESKYGIISTRSCYYIAVVKRPFNTRENGVTFPKTVGKKPVYVYERDGEKLLELYKIKQSQEL